MAVLAVRIGVHTARRLEGLVEQLGEWQHPDPRSQPADERRELGQRVPSARRQLGLATRGRFDRAPVRPLLAIDSVDTLSPTLREVTCSPTARTVPATSIPGTNGAFINKS